MGSTHILSYIEKNVSAAHNGNDGMLNIYMLKKNDCFPLQIGQTNCSIGGLGSVVFSGGR